VTVDEAKHFIKVLLEYEHEREQREQREQDDKRRTNSGRRHINKHGAAVN
jgi:hypothetical protein